MEANVLLVDGVAAYRSVLAGKLGALGYSVFEAGSAAEARAHLAARSFGVAVVDGSLPDEEGAALVTDLVDSGCKTKFVLVLEPTDEAMDVDDTAARSGAEVVVRGPVHPNALIQAVRGILGVRSSTPPFLGSISSTPPGPDAPRTRGIGRAAVLVASGDAAIREHVAKLLRTHGTAVVAIEERSKIASSLEHLRPHLAIIDSRLSDASGFEACRQLRTADLWRDLPILLLISAASPAERRACFDCGGDDFVEKPIAEAELLARVRVHVDLRLMREERLSVPRL
jgi:DNA-binding response OmpR family regulator